MSGKQTNAFKTNETVQNAIKNLQKAANDETIHAPQAIQILSESLNQEVITKDKHLEVIKAKNDKINQLAADNTELLEIQQVQNKFFHGMDETLLNIEETNEELRENLPRYKTPNLVAAINQVTREVRNIEKNLTVGEGRYAFKAVSDKDVKFQIGQAMERAGLAIVPKSIKPTANLERWEENFNGNTKLKQQVFTEVKTKYLLLHESGQKIEVSGYGHGIDSMDKSAGKATTYALKYALLYLFMVPTGTFDDADKTQPQQPQQPKQTLTEDQFQKALTAIGNGKYTREKLKSDYKLSESQLKQLK